MEEKFIFDERYNLYVSNYGYIVKNGRKCYPTIRKDTGYYVVNTGNNKVHRIHRLVAENFITNPDPKHLTDVNHIDGDKSNNRVDNLEWCDRSYNLKHAYDAGLHKKKLGEESWAAKLTLEQAQYIYDHYETDGFHSNTKELCEQFGITGPTVRAIVTGKDGNGRPQWTDVVRNRVFPEIKNNGQPKPVAKVNIDTGEVIETYSSIAEARKTNKGDIQACVSGKNKSAGGYGWIYI